MLNTEERNSLMGRIGSIGWVSMMTKTASATTEPANSPRIVVDVQGYSVPPQDNARVSPETDTQGHEHHPEVIDNRSASTASGRHSGRG